MFTYHLDHVSHPSSSSRIPRRQMMVLKPIDCHSRRRVGYCELQRFDVAHFSKFARSRSLQRFRSQVRFVAGCLYWVQLENPRGCVLLHPKLLHVKVFDSSNSTSSCVSFRHSRVTESTQCNCVERIQHHFETQSLTYSRSRVVALDLPTAQSDDFLFAP